MKISNFQLLIWCVGFLSPVWMCVVDLIAQYLTSASISGAWLYVSILLGAVVCSISIAFSRFNLWERIALVFVSWLLLAGEVLAIGALLIMTHGLQGTQ